MRKVYIFVLLSLLCISFVSALDCRQFYTLPGQEAQASDTLGKYFPSLVLDENLSTNWYGSLDASYPKWIFVDLGVERCLDSVALIAFARDTPILFSLQLSNDNQNWITVLENQTLITSAEPQIFSFGLNSARYIRVVQHSGARSYGTLTELGVNSAAILYEENNNRLALGVFGENKQSLLQDVPIIFTEGEVNTLELVKTSSSPSAIYKLSSDNHKIEVYCPYLHTTQDISPRTLLGKFLSRFVSLVASSSVTGKVTGYGDTDCFSDLDCFDWGLPPVQPPIQPPVQPPVAQQNETSPNPIPEIFTCDANREFVLENAKSSDTSSGYKAINVIDKNKSSSWYGNPSASYPKWISVDLGSNRCISSIELNLPEKDTPQSGYLEVSNDSINWRTLTSQFTLTNFDHTFDFNDTQARYVRLSLPSGSRTYGALSEFTIYGDAPSTSKAPVFQVTQNKSQEGTGDIKIVTYDRTGNAISDVPVTIIHALSAEPIIKKSGKDGSIVFSKALTTDTKVAVKCPVN